LHNVGNNRSDSGGFGAAVAQGFGAGLPSSPPAMADAQLINYIREIDRERWEAWTAGLSPFQLAEASGYVLGFAGKDGKKVTLPEDLNDLLLITGGSAKRQASSLAFASDAEYEERLRSATSDAGKDSVSLGEIVSIAAKWRERTCDLLRTSTLGGAAWAKILREVGNMDTAIAEAVKWRRRFKDLQADQPKQTKR